MGIITGPDPSDEELRKHWKKNRRSFFIILGSVFDLKKKELRAP